MSECLMDEQVLMVGELGGGHGWFTGGTGLFVGDDDRQVI